MKDEPEPKNSPLKRVLIVEDNANEAWTLVHLLKESGYDLRVAYDGISALKTMHEFRPDFALIDIGLPGATGYELARVIRRDPDIARTVLIAVTGWADDEDRDAALRNGFDFHIAKPADIDRLKAILHGQR